MYMTKKDWAITLATVACIVVVFYHAFTAAIQMWGI